MFTQYFVLPCFPIYQYPALVWVWVKAFVRQLPEKDSIADIKSAHITVHKI